MTIAGRTTLGEFLERPEIDEKPYLEFDDGVVTQKVSPTTSHNGVQADLVMRFNLHSVPRQLGRAFPEQRVSFAGASRVLDVAYFTWDRIPTNADGDLEDIVHYPPDLAVEIFSPGQTVRRLIERCRWYVDNGVRVALFVHPYRRFIMIFRPGSDPVELRGADRIDLGDVIPGFSLAVDELFASLRAR